MNELTPADLGVRSQLLVDKHAEYIRSFSKIWEVRPRTHDAAHRAQAGRHTEHRQLGGHGVPRSRQRGRGHTGQARQARESTSCPLGPAGGTGRLSTEPRPCLLRAQNTDKIEFVATEHFWMSGMYWGLTAMHLLGRLHEMDQEAIVSWVLSCQHPCGGFGGSARNDPHLLYTLSAVQILALYDRLGELDADKVMSCESARTAHRSRIQAGHAFAIPGHVTSPSTQPSAQPQAAHFPDQRMHTAANTAALQDRREGRSLTQSS